MGKDRVQMSAKPLYTVIVADDEDELREAVCTMIPWQELGFCLVGNASNGLDALQLVEKLEPDLLLTDIRMPFISGIELARQVREVRPATNIAFLSGHDDFEYAKQAIQYNIISYMLKPLTMEGLGAELQNIRRKIDAQYAMFRRAPPGGGSGCACRRAHAPRAGRLCRAPRTWPTRRPTPASAACCATGTTGPFTR
ncbi:MAG: response regulator [Lachnospiraceae bacterium]